MFLESLEPSFNSGCINSWLYLGDALQLRLVHDGSGTILAQYIRGRHSKL